MGRDRRGIYKLLCVSFCGEAEWLQGVWRYGMNVAKMMTPEQERRFVMRMARYERQWQDDVHSRLVRQRRVIRPPVPRKYVGRRVAPIQVWPVFGKDAIRWERQDGRCYWCCRSLHETGYHVDHLLPRCMGGTNVESNLRLSCPRCNSSKSGKLPMDFAVSLFLPKMSF